MQVFIKLRNVTYVSIYLIHFNVDTLGFNMFIILPIRYTG